MDEQARQEENAGIRAFLATGLALTAVGGAVIGLSWSASTTTVLAGALLAGAGQFLVMLALVARPARVDASA